MRFSQDGALVLVHDETLDRTTDGSGLVASHSLAEIKQLRTRGPSGAYTDERVPTLIELLSMTQGASSAVARAEGPAFC